MNYTKVYVDVTAKFLQDGRVIPLTVAWHDGSIYEIDRVTDVRRAASFEAGGVGVRYTCLIGGRQSFLFYEDSKKWFVEGKVQ